MHRFPKPKVAGSNPAGRILADNHLKGYSFATRTGLQGAMRYPFLRINPDFTHDVIWEKNDSLRRKGR